MTAQEAIKELKKHKETLNLWDCLPLDDLQSFDMAIEALEKQIPKKPEVSDEYHHHPCCPTCKSIFDADEEYYLKYGEWTYCGHCGQKIEWGE